MILSFTLTSGASIGLDRDSIWKVDGTSYGAIISIGAETYSVTDTFSEVVTLGDGAFVEFVTSGNTIAFNLGIIQRVYEDGSGNAVLVLKNGNKYIVDLSLADIVALGNAGFGGGTGQPLDATLTALAALTISADSLTIGTGADAFSQIPFAANTFPARASTGDLAAKSITDFGLSLVDDADASAARTTLGIGNVENTALSTWAGTTNITTIGTIATGTWNATEIGVTKGGTGLTALGTALQQLRVNAGATALEYFTPSAASGDISNGGNTTGAPLTIGTNDAFALNFETTGVTRMAITGGASTGGQVTITNVTANTNTVSDGLTIQTNSTGTAAASFGGGILFQGESSTTDNQDMARIAAYWDIATHASRSAGFRVQLVDNAGALATYLTLTEASSSGRLAIGSSLPVLIQADGITTAQSFTVGGSAQGLTLGGSSGTINITNSTNSATAINISNTSSGAAVVGGITIGSGVSATQTSGTRNYIDYTVSFAPTSGTAVHNQLVFSGTFNQTGGASGITRGIYLNQTLTAVADFRGLEIAYSNASAKGIYQTGSSTTNNFVGGTMFGSTSAPSAVAAIEVSSTTKGILLPRMTTAERDAISAVAGLLIYNTTTNKLNIYTTAWEAVTSA